LKVYVVPARRPEKVVVVPFPVAVNPPGVATIVQSPNEGSPLKATLPVEILQVGWVMAPTAGAEGISTITTEVVTTVLDGQGPDARIV
jgi:hypothetical protein